MNTVRILPIALAASLALAGCGESAQRVQQATAEAQQKVEAATAEGGAVATAIAEAREKLHTENLSLGDGEGLPKAELTPQGDLLIDGQAVAMTAQQRQAALAYRSEVLAVADAGMVMGQKGAGIAGDALALAAKGLFGGDTAEAEAKIEAQGKAMEADALRLCERVAGLEAAQERLAAVLPAFQPYSKAIDVSADCNVADATEGAESQADAAAAATDTVST